MPIMRCSRKVLFLTALLAGPAWPGSLGPGTDAALVDPYRDFTSAHYRRLMEDLLFQAKAAQRDRNYVKSLELVFEALLYHPDNAEARRLIKQVAEQAAASEVRRVQEERKMVLEQARRNYERRLELSALQENWDKRLKGYIEALAFLEAYDFLYETLEGNPRESWPKDKLHYFAEVVTRHRQAVEIKDSRYRDALWGFYFYTNESFPEAGKSWLAALSAPGSRIPEDRIRAYLKKITPEPKPLPLEAAPAEPIVAVAPARRKSARNARIAPQVASRPPLPPSGVQKQARDHYLSGLIFYGQGQVKEAMEEWRQALKAEPNDAKSRRALERAQKELEDLLR